MKFMYNVLNAHAHLFKLYSSAYKYGIAVAMHNAPSFHFRVLVEPPPFNSILIFLPKSLIQE